MSSCLLSIVTICFNDLAGLKKTEKSIRNIPELLACAEWIVIDGDSIDGTLTHLCNNITVSKFLSEPDHGIYDAMNKGIALSEGEYIIFMNSGDEFLKFNNVLEMLKSKKFDVISANSEVVSGSFKRIRRARTANYIWHGNPAIHQSMVYRGYICKEVLYDKRFLICGDYAFTAEFYKRGSRFGICDEISSRFNVGGISTTHWPKLISEAAYVQSKILRLPKTFILISKVKRLVSVLLTMLLYKLRF